MLPQTSPETLHASQALCTVERQVVGWFDVEQPERFQPHNFPVFIVHDERGAYYGECSAVTRH